VLKGGRPQGIIAAGGRAIFINDAAFLVLDKGAGLALVIQQLEGDHGQIGLFQHVRFGVDGQKFPGREAQPVFHLDDVEGGQDDIDAPAALGKAGDPGVAFELELAVVSQTHRGNTGVLSASFMDGPFMGVRWFLPVLTEAVGKVNPC
jgi:hypothetical protein